MRGRFPVWATVLAAAPALTSLDRDLADTISDSIVITGTNLAGATSVTWGGTAGTITANTSTSLTFTTPAKAAGTYNVQVTTAGGSSNTLSLEAWSPVQLSSALHGYRADAGVTQSTGSVSQWNDQVGTAHLAQATSGNRPTYNATDAGYGNKPTIQSSGSKWLEVVATISQPQGIWVVGEHNDTIIAFDAGALAGTNGGNGALYCGAVVNSGVAANSKHAALYIANGVSSLASLDNWLSGGVSGNAGTAGGASICVLARPGGTNSSVGKIAAAFLQGAAPNSTDKTKMAKWVKRFEINVT